MKNILKQKPVNQFRSMENNEQEVGSFFKKGGGKHHKIISMYENNN